MATFKECWREPDGRWMSYGGFPSQMAAIAGLFDETTLVVVQGDRRPGGIPLPAGARVVPLRRPAGEGWRRKLSVVRGLRHYVGTLARHIRQADAVHVPLPGDIPLLGMGIALALRKPMLARYGGSWARTSRTTVMNRVTRGCMAWFAGGANVMIATGEGAEPPSPGMSWLFSTALCGSELTAIRPRLDRALADPARLVYLGRLSPEKGVDILMRALAELRRRAPKAAATLTIVGDGPAGPELKRLARRLDVEALIRFTGQVPRTELGELLGVADLCVQPSLTEGFSKAWLDAFAHGLPVVSSRVGAAAAVLGADGERGWLVPPGDPDALARRLYEILTTPRDWPATRRRCREYVEQRTLEAWAREIETRCTRAWRRPLRQNGRTVDAS